LYAFFLTPQWLAKKVAQLAVQPALSRRPLWRCW